MIEDIASELTATTPNIKVSEEPVASNSFKQSPKLDSENHMPSSPGLRRRVVATSSFKERTHDTTEADTSASIKLDAAAEAHIQKHRKLQEDLTDEMVGLAQQLKERSLMMSRSLENTENILDSTETAIEQSLATTGHTNVRAMKIYSETSKTSCF
ncbi:Detected protein of confused Function [Hibiscus syriacus]|uniref:Detected protein of confused Function n=2 Tax=Hibiscus syriacus TaxID=106335 RepID=A0A6A2XT96_HIBSY|nr:Detected protein of confused Function [Hibiscus syriacus]